MFQSEAKCEAIHMTMVFNQERMSYVLSCFYSYTNKTHFHKEGSVVSLVTKVRLFVPVTRKWPIRHLYRSLNTPCLPPPPHPPSPYLTAVQREIENNACAKFWQANKVHFGRCATGEINSPFRLTLFLLP